MHLPFPAKDANFVLQFIHTRKNEIIIIILLFLQQKRKHSAMAFLTSRSASKHSFCSWCRSYSQTRCEGGVPTSESHKLHLRSVV